MSEPSPQLTRSTPKMRVPRPGLPWRRIFLVLFALAATACFVWVVQYYLTRTQYGVSVAGARVDGKTRAELEAEASSSAKKLQVRFTENSHTLTPDLDEVGVKVDTHAAAEKAFAARRGQRPLDDIQFWQVQDVPLVLKVDEVKLKSYLTHAFPGGYKAPQPPSLTYNSNVGQFDVVPGKTGRGFDAHAISLKLQQTAARPRALEFTASHEPVESLVTNTTAVYTQDEANKRLRLRLNFLYEDKIVYFPEPHEIASWLTFRPNDGTERLDIVYDKKKITSFLRSKVTNSLNSFFGPGSAEPAETDEKLAITDADALTEDVIDALRANESMEKEIEATTVGSDPHEVAP